MTSKIQAAGRLLPAAGQTGRAKLLRAPVRRLR